MESSQSRISFFEIDHEEWWKKWFYTITDLELIILFVLIILLENEKSKPRVLSKIARIRIVAPEKEEDPEENLHQSQIYEKKKPILLRDLES